MKIEEVTKDKRKLRTVIITIRTFPRYARFMKDKNISPSLVFNKALEELMPKETKKV